MDKRRKPIDKEAARDQRAELYEAIDRGQISLRDAVKRMRKISGLTQTEFAGHRGVSAKVIKEIERGTGNPTVNTLNQIGKFFGLEVTFVRTANIRSESDTQQQIITERLKTFKTDTALSGAWSDAIWTDRPPHSGNYSNASHPWKDSRASSALHEMRELIFTLEKMRELASPSKSVQEALQNINAADKLLIRTPGLQAIEEARRIVETADEIQRQVQPPKEVQAWLENVENIRQILEPLHRIDWEKKSR